MLPTLLEAALSLEHASAAAMLEGERIYSGPFTCGNKTVTWCLPLPADKAEWHILLLATCSLKRCRLSCRVPKALEHLGRHSDASHPF